jgi:hypothetical protein
VSDVCTAGVCGGSPLDCVSAGDQCNTGVCNEETNACEPRPVEAGTVCDDGDACTSNDVCESGTCHGRQTYGIPEWRRFHDCYGGIGSEIEDGCDCFDFDADGDVDLRDVAEFTRRFEGN